VLLTVEGNRYDAAPAEVSISVSGENSRSGGKIGSAPRAFAGLPMFRQMGVGW
jgi:hypothetical protein